jgi:hypothetical protein
MTYKLREMYQDIASNRNAFETLLLGNFNRSSEAVALQHGYWINGIGKPKKINSMDNYYLCNTLYFIQDNTDQLWVAEYQAGYIKLFEEEIKKRDPIDINKVKAGILRRKLISAPIID